MTPEEFVDKIDKMTIEQRQAYFKKPKAFDSIENPKHYVSHPSGIEAIQIEEHFNFCLGNVIKYIFRCDLKGNPIEDLKKAQWYLNREIQRREREATTQKN